jgi:hypothetical protein
VHSLLSGIHLSFLFKPKITFDLLVYSLMPASIGLLLFILLLLLLLLPLLVLYHHHHHHQHFYFVVHWFSYRFIRNFLQIKKNYYIIYTSQHESHPVILNLSQRINICPTVSIFSNYNSCRYTKACVLFRL